jgi:CDP-diacylglycerol--serine O-phosphatidyltransferase
LPIFVVVVLFFALLISYPWEILAAGTLIYLAGLPLGWMSYRDYQRKDAAVLEAKANPPEPAAAVDADTFDQPPKNTGEKRPPRLN